MAVCVQPDQSGVLHVAPTQEPCAGYMLVTPDDKIAFLERIFDPAAFTTSDYATVFNLGFSMPVLAYLTAWSFQTIISFLTKDNHHD